jgi:hypothetical protein
LFTDICEQRRYGFSWDHLVTDEHRKTTEVPMATPSSEEAARDFRSELERRAAAAKGLERDLLAEVPLLYGSPGRGEPHGDPGIVLAKLHRDEMIRRNGGDVPPPAKCGGGANLPYERLLIALALALFLLLGFWR